MFSRWIGPRLAIQLALAIGLTIGVGIAPAGGGLGSVPVVAAQSPDDQYQKAQEIAKQLKCPVCQNLSVADSPSPLAEQMRGIIQEKVAAGESREQIIAYFSQRYGEDVLLEPPKAGFGQVVWWGAGLGFLAGAGAVGYFLVRRARGGDETAADPDLSDTELAEYDALLERALETGDPPPAPGPPDLRPAPSDPGQRAW